MRAVRTQSADKPHDGESHGSSNCTVLLGRVQSIELMFTGMLIHWSRTYGLMPFCYLNEGKKCLGIEGGKGHEE